MLTVEDFVPDYERMFAGTEDLGQDGFWTAEPFTGIPWMEAILGCEIYANEESFSSKPWMKSLDEIERITVDPSNGWLLKYLEFTRRLVEVGQGRFTVGTPSCGALGHGRGDLGPDRDDLCPGRRAREDEGIFSPGDGGVSVSPAGTGEARPRFSRRFLSGVLPRLLPGTSIWFQEDLSAIMSPEMYGEFLDGPARLICRGHEYTGDPPSSRLVLHP